MRALAARRWLLVVAAVILTFGVALATAVAFGVARPPTPLRSVAEAIKRLDLSGLPSLSWYRARDGAMLAYRGYPGNRQQVAVLIHGSTGQSPGMHALARTLQQAGVTAYALDMRGHGSSGRRGDIDYVGQLDDDLADFMAYVRPTRPNATYTLVGFSAGGAFALRIACSSYGKLFDSYIAISPALIYPKGVARPNNGGWATVSVLRIAGLLVLNGLGIHRFDGLNVVTYASPLDDAFFTRTYSYRLAMNFSPGLNYLSALTQVKKPVAVVAGADDEEFFADRYAALLKPRKPDIRVEIVPGVGHIGAMAAAPMLEAVRRAVETVPR